MAFVPGSPSCAAGLVDQGCAALLAAPPKSSPSPPSDALPPARYARILPRRSKAGEGFIKRNYSGERKRRRGWGYKRCSSEQIRWLSNIGRKDKQRRRRHSDCKTERGFKKRTWHEAPLLSFVIACNAMGPVCIHYMGLHDVYRPKHLQSVPVL